MTNGKINIDDFLETIMDSEKFDEMVDKIASKAVEKFSKLKNVDTEQTSVLSADSKTDAAYRVAEVKIKDSNFSESNLDNTEAEISTTQRYVGKIDTEAFIKKESADSSKSLSLKFKHFKKSEPGKNSEELIEPILDSGEVTPSNEINDDRSKGAENNQLNQKVSANVAKELASDTEITTIKTDGNYRSTKLNKKKTNKTFKSTPQDKNSKESSKEKESQIEMEENSNPASEQKETTKKKQSEKNKSKASNKDRTVEVNNEGSSESGSVNKDDTKQSEEKSDAGYKIRKPEYEYLKLPNPDLESITKSEDHLESTTLKLRIKDKIKFSKVKVKQKETSNSYAPVLVREEGNQLYTQERSPDYEDYHNELQNQLKKKSVK